MYYIPICIFSCLLIIFIHSIITVFCTAIHWWRWLYSHWNVWITKDRSWLIYLATQDYICRQNMSTSFCTSKCPSSASSRKRFPSVTNTEQWTSLHNLSICSLWVELPRTAHWWCPCTVTMYGHTSIFPPPWSLCTFFGKLYLSTPSPKDERTGSAQLLVWHFKNVMNREYPSTPPWTTNAIVSTYDYHLYARHDLGEGHSESFFW